MTDEKRQAGSSGDEAAEQHAGEQEVPELREGYEAASSPSKQGDGDPRPQEAAGGEAASREPAGS